MWADIRANLWLAFTLKFLDLSLWKVQVRGVTVLICATDRSDKVIRVFFTTDMGENLVDESGKFVYKNNR